jgi:hypothetical protein
MGYYTQYSMGVFYADSLEPVGDKLMAQVEKQIAETDEYAHYILFENPWDETNWYDHEQDMKVFSVLFPDLLFTLSGDGEEQGDVWRKFFVRGKMSGSRLVSGHPDFVVGSLDGGVVELKNLVGLHQLEGVDFGVNNQLHRDASVCLFRLDGVTYAAMEDPEDGYRSMLKGIVVTEQPLLNKFPPVPVMATFTDADEDSILTFYSLETSRVLFRIGTDYTDSYYPMFIFEFHPENRTKEALWQSGWKNRVSASED